MGEKLKPCPFCEGEAIYWPAGSLQAEGIINELAGCDGTQPGRTHTFLRMNPQAWNRRQSQEPLMEVLREARAVIHQHYVDWDGEPEDAVPLQLMRSKLDTILSGEVDRG